MTCYGKAFISYQDYTAWKANKENVSKEHLQNYTDMGQMKYLELNLSLHGDKPVTV
jgi:hypothetical protein